MLSLSRCRPQMPHGHPKGIDTLRRLLSPRICAVQASAAAVAGPGRSAPTPQAGSVGGRQPRASLHTSGGGGTFEATGPPCASGRGAARAVRGGEALCGGEGGLRPGQGEEAADGAFPQPGVRAAAAAQPRGRRAGGCPAPPHGPLCPPGVQGSAHSSVTGRPLFRRAAAAPAPLSEALLGARSQADSGQGGEGTGPGSRLSSPARPPRL